MSKEGLGLFTFSVACSGGSFWPCADSTVLERPFEGHASANGDDASGFKGTGSAGCSSIDSDPGAPQPSFRDRKSMSVHYWCNMVVHILLASSVSGCLEVDV